LFYSAGHSGSISSSVPKNYSHSAPTKQEPTGWSFSAYEVLSFLNLRGILRSRGGDTASALTNGAGSGSNSEAGTPPNKDGVLNERFSTTPLSQTSISLEATVTSQRRGSRVSTTVAHEATPMLEEGAQGVNHPDMPKYGHSAKMLTCHCPPDADFPYLNLKEFRFVDLDN